MVVEVRLRKPANIALLRTATNEIARTPGVARRGFFEDFSCQAITCNSLLGIEQTVSGKLGGSRYISGAWAYRTQRRSKTTMDWHTETKAHRF